MKATVLKTTAIALAPTVAAGLTTVFSAALLCSAARGEPLGSVERTCMEGAARYHGVSPRLLKAMASVESNGNVHAVNRNENGTFDLGLMQINTAWLTTLSRYGISRQALFDPCVNVYVAAWVLSHNIARLGLTWNAVGAYNAQTPFKRVAYARRVYRVLTTNVDRPRPALPAPPALPTP